MIKGKWLIKFTLLRLNLNYPYLDNHLSKNLMSELWEACIHVTQRFQIKNAQCDLVKQAIKGSVLIKIHLLGFISITLLG